MLENYLDKMNITVMDMKDYLYSIDSCYDESIELCFMVKQIKHKVDEHYDDYMIKAIQAIYAARGYQEIENHLVMMNYFFEGHPQLDMLKRSLKKMLLGKPFTTETYRVLRHVMSLDKKTLINALYEKHYVNEETAAYLSLVEKEIDTAYYYLSLLDDCHNEGLLDLYASYSTTGYIKLMYQYQRNNKGGHYYGTKNVQSFTNYSRM